MLKASIKRKPEQTTAAGIPAISNKNGLALVTGTDFDSIVRENGKRLFNLAYHMLGNAEEAEEAVQDIFLEAYTALPGFRGNAPLKNWLHRIAMNVLADHIGAKKRKPRIACDVSFEDRAKTGAMPVSAASAESEYIKASEMERIRKAVLKLPAKQRAVFVLNVIEGYTHKEISGILGISPGAARVMRVRAAQAIRNEISKTGS